MKPDSFPMRPDRLLQLLRNIRDLQYPVRLLSNVATFEQKLAEDLGVDREEAMALLGYLLNHQYVRIVPDPGLVLNRENEEIKKLLETGQLDRGAGS